MTLYELKGQYLELLQLAESGEYDMDALLDTLEGIDGEIEVKAENYAKVIKELEGRAAMLDTEIKRLSGIKTAIEGNAKTIKENLHKAMNETGKVKFKTNLFSFGIQKNPPSLVIDNPDEVPGEFKIPQPDKVDNAKIKELLKTETLPYAHLEQGESLRIR